MNKKQAIEFLNEKLGEIPHLAKLPYNNTEHLLWRNSIEDVLEEVFGRNSTEYKRFYETRSVISLLNPKGDYIRLLKKRSTVILSIIQKYEILGIETEPEVKAEQKNAIKSPLQLFDELKIHPRVIEASKKLFEDGHYRDAIYRAFVEVNNFVKLRAKSQLDGKKLMSTVFSLDNPTIRLNPLETQTDKDEQEGFMFLFMGAMQGIRNPKAHENIIQNNPYIALKLIGFASLLMETISFWEARET